MSNSAYVVKDGDTAEQVTHAGAVHMHVSVGFCELCGCYRHSHEWHVMRRRGTPYAACGRHTPIDRALWEAEP